MSLYILRHGLAEIKIVNSTTKIVELAFGLYLGVNPTEL